MKPNPKQPITYEIEEKTSLHGGLKPWRKTMGANSWSTFDLIRSEGQIVALVKRPRRWYTKQSKYGPKLVPDRSIASFPLWMMPFDGVLQDGHFSRGMR